MDAISYTAARANLANTMANVCNDHAPVIITRKSEAPVVMMSLEDLNASICSLEISKERQMRALENLSH